MKQQEFKAALGRINSSFQSSKNLIGATSSSWKIHSSRLQQIAGKFNDGGSVSKGELKELRKIWVSNTPFIDEKGKPFVMYIQDHSHMSRYGGSDYRKFHVAWCRTLDRMEQGGRYDRYHKKNDIENPAFAITFDRNSSAKKELRVCKNCLSFMATEESDTRFTVDTFSMPEFFAKYTNRNLKQPTRRTGVSDYYPEDWGARSRRIREEANWICEDCGKSFVNDKGKLHVHHKNGVPGEVRRSNLEVVCENCHANKFAHGHMRQGNTGFAATANSSRHTTNSSSLTRSERNKFTSFVSSPEKYATGSSVTREKVNFLKALVKDKKDELTEAEKSSFLNAVAKYHKLLK